MAPPAPLSVKVAISLLVPTVVGSKYIVPNAVVFANVRLDVAPPVITFVADIPLTAPARVSVFAPIESFDAVV